MTNFKGKKTSSPQGEIVAQLLKENGEVINENNKLRVELKKTRLNPDMGHLEYNWCIDQLTKIKAGFDTAKPLIDKVEVPEQESKIILLNKD